LLQSGLELDDQVPAAEFLKTVYDNPPFMQIPTTQRSTKTFIRKGFKMRDWDKKPYSVKAGIEIVRAS